MGEDSILLGYDPGEQSPGKMTMNLIIMTIKEITEQIIIARHTSSVSMAHTLGNMYKQNL